MLGIGQARMKRWACWGVWCAVWRRLICSSLPSSHDKSEWISIPAATITAILVCYFDVIIELRISWLYSFLFAEAQVNVSWHHTTTTTISCTRGSMIRYHIKQCRRSLPPTVKWSSNGSDPALIDLRFCKWKNSQKMKKPCVVFWLYLRVLPYVRIKVRNPSTPCRTQNSSIHNGPYAFRPHHQVRDLNPDERDDCVL